MMTLTETRQDYQRQLKNMRAKLSRANGNNPGQIVANIGVRNAMQSIVDTLVSRVASAKRNEKLYG